MPYIYFSPTTLKKKTDKEWINNKSEIIFLKKKLSLWRMHPVGNHCPDRQLKKSDNRTFLRSRRNAHGTTNKTNQNRSIYSIIRAHTLKRYVVHTGYSKND